MLADVLVGGLVVTALLFDLKTRRIPNWLTVPAVGAGLFLHAAARGTEGVVFGVQGLAVGLGLMFLPFVLGWIGGGDVKLLGAVGTLKGAGFAATAVLCTALWGGLVALAAIIYARRLSILGHFGAGLKLYVLTAGRVGAGVFGPTESESDGGRLTVPYAVAVFLGVLSAYLVSVIQAG